MKALLPFLGLLVASSLLLGILSSKLKAEAQNEPIQGEEAKARESVGILIRAHQTYYEQNQKIAPLFYDLKVASPFVPGYGVGIISESLQSQSVIIYAKPFKAELKGYIGGVYITQKKTAIIGICEATKPGFPPGFPTVVSEVKSIECPAGYQLLTP